MRRVLAQSQRDWNLSTSATIVGVLILFTWNRLLTASIFYEEKPRLRRTIIRLLVFVVTYILLRTRIKTSAVHAIVERVNLRR